MDGWSAAVATVLLVLSQAATTKDLIDALMHGCGCPKEKRRVDLANPFIEIP
jgi:hypothetical protein